MQELRAGEREAGGAPGLARRVGGAERVRAERLAGAAEDGDLAVVERVRAGRVGEGELPARRLGVGEDVVFEGGRDARDQLLVAERGGLERGMDAGGDARPDAADEQDGGRVAAVEVLDGGGVIDLDGALAVVAVHAEIELPGRGRAAGGDAAAEAEAGARAFAVEEAVGAEREDPGVPGIARGRDGGARAVGGLVERDVETGGDGGRRGEADEAELDRAREAPADHVRRGVAGADEAERVADTVEAATADVVERVGPAAGAGRLERDQQVDVGGGAVADVVDEPDLGAHVLGVATRTVEVDAHGRVRGVALLPGGGHRKQERREQDGEEATRADHS